MAKRTIVAVFFLVTTTYLVSEEALVRIAAKIALGATLAGMWGCAATEKAAAQDPMRCERDPACSKGRGTYIDCSRQCNDDPECTDRCREMQIDRNGRP